MAISLNSLKPAKGSTHKKKRVGRGPGSGLARPRAAVRRGKSLVRAIRVRSVLKAVRCRCTGACPSAVSPTSSKSSGWRSVLAALDQNFSANEEITPEVLHSRGLIKKAKHDVVVLGNGDVSKPLRVSAHRFTKSARAKDREGWRCSGGDCRLVRESPPGGFVMEKFLAAVRNMFNVPDLRRRIFFTLGLLAVYRLGAHVGAPGINKAASRSGLA